VTNSQLTHLDVRDCGITAEGMQSLAAAVASCTSLQILKLDENNLAGDGAEALADALARNTSLEELHVSSTSIGDEGET
jgi:Ran GTPase-activating protein (RanGAP) involved in mRNA processing and transport